MHTLAVVAVAVVAVLADAAVRAGQIVTVRVLMTDRRRATAFIHVCTPHTHRSLILASTTTSADILCGRPPGCTLHYATLTETFDIRG